MRRLERETDLPREQLADRAIARALKRAPADRPRAGLAFLILSLWLLGALALFGWLVSS